MKISISITKEENSFLDRLVREGNAANKSHAVRLCIASMKKTRGSSI
ncbi:MAG: hypothetical protein QXV17_04415 [Candidatus Micrarchaeaceae archaeon]